MLVQLPVILTVLIISAGPQAKSKDTGETSILQRIPVLKSFHTTVDSPKRQKNPAKRVDLLNWSPYKTNTLSASWEAMFFENYFSGAPHEEEYMTVHYPLKGSRLTLMGREIALSCIPREKGEAAGESNKNAGIDLKKNPNFSLTYNLQAPSIQFFSLQLGIDSDGDGVADIIGSSETPSWITKDCAFNEIMANVEIKERSKLYLVKRDYGLGSADTAWHVAPQHTTCQVVEDKARKEGPDGKALRLRSCFDDALDEYVIFVRRVNPIDLEKYPYIGVEYKVEDPGVQTIEVILRIDTDDDGRPEEVVAGEKTHPLHASNEFSWFGFNAYELAQKLLAGHGIKSYKLIEIGIYPRKIWGVGCGRNPKDYDFWLKQVQVYQKTPKDLDSWSGANKLHNDETGQKSTHPLTYFWLSPLYSFSDKGDTTISFDIFKQLKKIRSKTDSCCLVGINFSTGKKTGIDCSTRDQMGYYKTQIKDVQLSDAEPTQL
jgi:hypothetical protein